MVKPQKSNHCYRRRLLRVMVVSVTSIALMAVERNDAHAAWSLLPFGRKPETDAKQKPTPNKGFSDAIRKLMAEAKVFEEKGNLDRAIDLADRAKKLSASSSSYSKPASDVSPEATARYADDLRLKKTEQSVRRLGGTPPRGQSPASDGALPRSFSTVDNSSPPTPKVVAVTRAPGTIRDSKSSAKPPSPPSVAASQPPDITLTVATRSSNDVTSASYNSEEQPSATGASIQPLILRRTAFDDDTAPKSDDIDPIVTPKITSKSNSVDDWISADDKTPRVTPKPSSSTKTTVQIPKVETNSKRLKLRSTFTTNERFNTQFAVSSERYADAPESQPTINPVASSLPQPKKSTEPRRIQVISAEYDPASQATSANDLQDNRQSETKKVDNERPWYDLSENEFPSERVVELKRRLDSAASLSPGEITAKFPSNRVETQSEEPASELESERIQKSDAELSDERPETTKPNATRGIGRTVVGRTSMISWRSAKNASSIPASTGIGAKTDRITGDLRQSLREQPSTPSASSPNSTEPSLFSLPAVVFDRSTGAARQTGGERSVISSSGEITNTKTQLRGSLWDNAIAPSIDGFSGTIDGSSKTTESTPISFGSAPPPPPEEVVEQISFDPPRDLFNRSSCSNDKSKSNASLDISSAPCPEDAVGGTGSSNSNGSTGDQKTSSRPRATSSPLERLAGAFGIPISNASSVFGEIILVTFFMGVWTIRVAIRSKKS